MYNFYSMPKYTVLVDTNAKKGRNLSQLVPTFQS